MAAQRRPLLKQPQRPVRFEITATLRQQLGHTLHDPGLPFAEVQGTIPQALLMMNSLLVHTRTAATGKTLLADLLAKGKSDEEVVAALYVKVLARKPTVEEQATCQRFIKKVGDRKEALEDVLWTLVNSTEFLLKK